MIEGWCRGNEAEFFDETKSGEKDGYEGCEQQHMCRLALTSDLPHVSVVSKHLKSLLAVKFAVRGGVGQG